MRCIAHAILSTLSMCVENYCTQKVITLKLLRVTFLLCLVFVDQATWLFFVALITHPRQIFLCLIFIGQTTHENLSPMKIFHLQ